MLRAAMQALELTMPAVPDTLMEELSAVREARRLPTLAVIRAELDGLTRGTKQIHKELRHLQARQAEADAADSVNRLARLALEEGLSSFVQESFSQIDATQRSLQAAEAASEQLVEYLGAGGEFAALAESAGREEADICVALVAGFLDSVER